MALDPETFPSPRLDRGGPVAVLGAPGGAAAAPPQSLTVPFRISVGANQRSTHSLGPLLGPALIRTLSCHFANVAGAFSQCVDVGYSQSAIEESLVAASASRPWTSAFRRLDFTAGVNLANDVRGIFSSSDLTQQLERQYDLDVPVLLPQWFLVVSVLADGATAIDVNGHVSILLGVSLQALANFL